MRRVPESFTLLMIELLDFHYVEVQIVRYLCLSFKPFIDMLRTCFQTFLHLWGIVGVLIEKCRNKIKSDFGFFGSSRVCYLQ